MVFNSSFPLWSINVDHVTKNRILDMKSFLYRVSGGGAIGWMICKTYITCKKESNNYVFLRWVNRKHKPCLNSSPLRCLMRAFLSRHIPGGHQREHPELPVRTHQHLGNLGEFFSSFTKEEEKQYGWHRYFSSWV